MAKNKGLTDITIFPAWCKGCAICVTFCPAKVLALNEAGKSSVVALEECINCGFCELHCPDFAIMIRPRDGQCRRKTDKTPKAETSSTQSRNDRSGTPAEAGPEAPAVVADSGNDTKTAQA